MGHPLSPHPALQGQVPRSPPQHPPDCPTWKGPVLSSAQRAAGWCCHFPSPWFVFPQDGRGRPAAPFRLGSGFEGGQAPSISGCTKHARDSLCLVDQPLSLLRSSSGRCSAFSLALHPPFSSSPQRTPRLPWGPQGQRALTPLSAGVWCHLVRSHQGCSAGEGPIMGLCSALGCSPKKSQLYESQLVPHSCCSPPTFPSSHCTPRSPHTSSCWPLPIPWPQGRTPSACRAPRSRCEPVCSLPYTLPTCHQSNRGLIQTLSVRHYLL